MYTFLCVCYVRGPVLTQGATSGSRAESGIRQISRSFSAGELLIVLLSWASIMSGGRFLDRKEELREVGGSQVPM